MRLLVGVLLSAAALAVPAVAHSQEVKIVRTAPAAGTIVLPLTSAADLDRIGGGLDPAVRTAVARGLAAAAFDYKPKSTLSLRGLGAYDRILVVGMGSGPLDAVALQNLGGTAAAEAGSGKAGVAIVAGGLPATAAADIALGYRLGSYRFDRYKSGAKPATAPLSIVAAGGDADASAHLADAVAFVRDLITEPANIVYPESFVDRTRKSFAGVGNVRIEALDVPAMEKLGMGAVLSVGKGSVRPPRLLVVEYRGGSGAPIVLAGKGITFDSGGISIKPGAGMARMKYDMSGAAAVTGAVLSLAKSKAPVNVVAIAALAENMPGGGATRPGDVVKTYNGKTIEIINTDAEGRVVLADAVAYGADRFTPAAVVDLATLTGAVRTALGDDYAGLFSRQDALADQLLAAGRAAGEPLWRLPVDPSHVEDMKSEIADIANSKEGGTAGASLGAAVIGSFVPETTPWAHLDIASVAWNESADPTVPKGAAGFGVRLLDRFVRDFKPLMGRTAGR